MNLTMKDLEKCFETAKENNRPFVGVAIAMQGFPKPEVIINPEANYDEKLDYYKKAYNDDLTLKTFNGIRIVGFACANNYHDIVYRETTTA